MLTNLVSSLSVYVCAVKELQVSSSCVLTVALHTSVLSHFLYHVCLQYCAWCYSSHAWFDMFFKLLNITELSLIGLS